MMKRIIGWVSILLAAFSLAPSIVPGAMSLMGFGLSLSSLVLSVFSVGKNSKKYFDITLIFVVFGVFLINDALRLWESLSIPLSVKLTSYAIFVVIVVACKVAAERLSKGENIHNKAN